MTKVGPNLRTNERASIHHLGHVFEALTDLDVIHGRIDRRKCT